MSQSPPRLEIKVRSPLGNPAAVVRALRPDELDWKRRGTEEYQQLARRSLQTMRETDPLPEAQVDRPRYVGSTFKPKGES